MIVMGIYKVVVSLLALNWKVRVFKTRLIEWNKYLSYTETNCIVVHKISLWKKYSYTTAGLTNNKTTEVFLNRSK